MSEVKEKLEKLAVEVVNHETETFDDYIKCHNGGYIQDGLTSYIKACARRYGVMEVLDILGIHFYYNHDTWEVAGISDYGVLKNL